MNKSISVKVTFELSDSQSENLHLLEMEGLDNIYDDSKYMMNNFIEDLLDKGATDYELNSGWIDVTFKVESGDFVSSDIAYFEAFIVSILGSE